MNICMYIHTYTFTYTYIRKTHVFSSWKHCVFLMYAHVRSKNISLYIYLFTHVLTLRYTLCLFRLLTCLFTTTSFPGSHECTSFCRNTWVSQKNNTECIAMQVQVRVYVYIYIQNVSHRKYMCVCMYIYIYRVYRTVSTCACVCIHHIQSVSQCKYMCERIYASYILYVSSKHANVEAVKIPLENCLGALRQREACCRAYPVRRRLRRVATEACTRSFGLPSWNGKQVAVVNVGWLRLVGSLKLGRAAARRTTPKLPHAIRASPNEGDTKIGGGVIREVI